MLAEKQDRQTMKDRRADIHQQLSLTSFAKTFENLIPSALMMFVNLEADFDLTQYSP